MAENHSKLRRLGMDLNSLKQYVNWVGRSPEEILREVKNHGGWKIVFPGRLPVWAHKIRNYFNIEPRSLMLLDESSGRPHLQEIYRNLNVMQGNRLIKLEKGNPVLRQVVPGVNLMQNPPAGTPDFSIKDHLGEDLGLSGDVYKDNAGTIWYQMSAGGTIYHFKDPKMVEAEAALQEKLGQWRTPVFKLISPDKTGGSRETIIKNRLNTSKGQTFEVGTSVIGDVNKHTPVASLIETDPWYQGSYNYSETVITGLAAHGDRDVVPHKVLVDLSKPRHLRNVYVNPDRKDRHGPLCDRKFPPYDNRGRLLSAQIYAE